MLRNSLCLVAVGAPLLVTCGAASASTEARSPTIKASKKIIDYTRSVKVTGQLKGDTGGTTIRLEANEFPFSGFKVIRQTSTNTNGRYTFKVKPALGTRYRTSTATTPAVRSKTAVVYVEPLVAVVLCNYCGSGPTGPGHFTFHYAVDVRFPASAHLETYPVYLYWGQKNGAQTPPSSVKRVGQGTTQLLQPGHMGVKFKHRFAAPAGPYAFAFTICGRDHFATNGIGLPGHHHCGDGTIGYPAYTHYIG